MWYKFLRDNYTDLAEWIAYSNMYGLADRLGYRTPVEAWNANPFIQGSSNPADYAKTDTSAFNDGEVIGIDNDERLIMWDRQGGVAYNCGETLDDYGDENLTEVECKRLGIVWRASVDYGRGENGQ